MEVDCCLEPFLVSEAPRVALDLLDHGVKALGAGVGRAGNDGRQDALEMSLDRSSHLLDRLEPRQCMFGRRRR